MSRSEKTFDAVAMMRSIRDRVSAEIEGMTLQEELEWLASQELHEFGLSRQKAVYLPLPPPSGSAVRSVITRWASMDKETVIELRLNSAGFSGADVDELLPEFVTERPVTVGLTWWPSAEGPESWTLLVAAGITVAGFLKKFAEKLAEDLHEWAKSKLSGVLARKKHPIGFFTIKLEDVTITVLPIEDGEFVSLCQNLTSVLRQIDPNTAHDWTAVRGENGRWVAIAHSEREGGDA